MMTSYFKGLLFSNETDTVSSPSVVLDKPSGNYLVLINLKLHKNKEKLEAWENFFTGKDAGIIFEDIACSVAKTDVSGTKMADSFRSKLPENQMKIKKEDAILLVSRAEEGDFDTLVISLEFAKSYKLEKFPDFIKVIKLSEEKNNEKI